MNDIIPGSRAVLGFSGGVDSVVLSHVLLQQYNIRPYLLHVNYGLRNEADEDEKWCRWFAQEYRFELHVLKANPKERKDKNVQNWARDLRYSWFEKKALEVKADYIFTAHHLDDRRETFLMNALRGAGMIGLTGLSNPNIVRPLSDWSKEEILNFAQENALSWREDLSNAATKYTRNKVRHLLPAVLDQVEPRWKGGLKKTIENLTRDRTLLLAFMTEFEQNFVSKPGNEWIISEGKWAFKPHAQTLLFRYANAIDKGFSFDEVGQVYRGEIGQIVQGRKNILVRQKGHWIIAPAKEVDSVEYLITSEKDFAVLPFELRLEKKSVTEVQFGPDSEWISTTNLPFPWKIRVWRAGDEFRPLGMRGKKKVANFLNDIGVPTHHKPHVYVALREEEIFWVLGHRIGQEARIVDGDQSAYLATLKF